jgi:hypothetical protein
VLDAGCCGARGSHHQAAFEAFLDYIGRAKQPITGCRYYVSSTFRHSFPSAIRSPRVAICPTFVTEFYGYRWQETLAGLFAYIATLAGEYRAVLQELADGPWQRSRIVLPSLQWPHLMALRIGMRGLNMDRAEIIVCAEGVELVPYCESLDLPSRAYWKAITELTAFRNIRVRFSAFEYASEAIAKVFRKGCPLDYVHGLMFLDSSCRIPHYDTKSQRFLDLSRSRICLYCGDPKREKGFFDLYHLLIDLPSADQRRTAYVVQVASGNHTLEIDQELLKLRMVAEQRGDVQLEFEALDNLKLFAFFSSLDLIYINYDPKRYHGRTSGILWIAALLDVPVLFSTESTLILEAKRICRHFAVLSNEATFSEFASQEDFEFEYNEIDEGYVRKLQGDFWSECSEA